MSRILSVWVDNKPGVLARIAGLIARRGFNIESLAVSITEEDVHSMFEMRLLVEPYALRTYGNAIPREQLEAYAELMHHSERIEDFCKSDDDFHELLMSTLPNKYLRSAYDRITGLNTRFRIMTGKVSMINQEQTCEEHLQILDAALAGDWDGAAMALQQAAPEGAVELSCCATVEGSRALARKKGIAALVILTAGGMTEEAI